MSADLSPLRQSFKGDIVDPSSPDFEQALKRWSKLSERKASVVVYPTSTEDVVAALKYARANQLEVAIKGMSFSSLHLTPMRP